MPTTETLIRPACLAMLLLVAPCRAADTDPARPDLSWLVGDWCSPAGQTRIEEHWLLRGGVLLGLGASTRGDKLTDFEYTRIEPRGTGWVFIAQPGGAPPTEFAQADSHGQRVDFRNLAHDFPQRVSYWRDDTGLHAEIAGPGRDGEQRIGFDYTACPAD
ncbi:DUF6265 family protein [Arenimonas oryziterrae]|uniref:DUF6265 domain-containing protein n=1 Tax=Arenimonas oryziterrae DSM 21050 = YC6267 TaxID=1121015 RepID=A0A091BDQ7_9GAMM|nr:DUF6265 family protein [Arenimonas oryziterrae]KFN42520.1 hypothetical protein N789_12840 [Arenimonas oryziterrae DSM 21050 = YC6267]